MLQITVPDPEKYTDVRIEQLGEGSSYPGEMHQWGTRVLIGVFSRTVDDLTPHYSNSGRPEPNRTVERVFAITARVTSTVIEEGLARIEKHDQAMNDLARAHADALRERAATICALDAEISSAKKAIAAIQGANESLVKDGQQRTDALAESHRLRRKLEADLAKVRQYYGDKGYNDALAGAPNPNKVE